MAKQQTLPISPLNKGGLVGNHTLEQLTTHQAKHELLVESHDSLKMDFKRIVADG